MQPLKAHVKNGQLVLDNPATDLPEGEVVYLHPVHGIVPRLEDDAMTDDERAALHDELQVAIAESDAGETISYAEMVSELRQRR